MNWSENKVIQEINNSIDVVSFDFFDTLFFRDVNHPQDVFSLVSLECTELLSDLLTDKREFKNDRIMAEKKAREIYKREIVLDEIYDCFPATYSDETKRILREAEISIELKVCVPNDEIVRLLEHAHKYRKKVIIISDFYMGRNFIELLLNKFNILVDDVFVSCDEDGSKSKGDLFDIVLKKLNLQKKRLLHVGDNYNSDYKRARERGVKAIHYNIKTHYNRFVLFQKQELATDYTYRFIEHRCFITCTDENEEDGYRCLGPLLYGFCNWLYRELQNKKINHVFFLSRDGLIIKKAFDVIFADRKEIKTHYFYASRRALQVALITEITNLDDLFDCIHFEDTFSLNEFYTKLGMSDAWIKEYCSGNGLDEKRIISKDVLIKSKLSKVIYYEALDFIAENARKERKGFLKYAQKQCMNGKVAIVDIGWFGHMQRNIERLLNQNTEIYGYYIALDPNSGMGNKQCMKGYLFDSSHNQYIRDLERRFNKMFELMFTANHGSLLNYGDGVELVFKENENTDNWNNLGKFQEGALKFVRDYSKYALFKEIDLYYVIDQILGLFMKPSKEKALKWEGMEFEDFGKMKNDSTKGFRYYIMHPIQFVKDYKNAQWKFGYLCANLTDMVPYYLLFMWVDKLRGKRV